MGGMEVWRMGGMAVWCMGVVEVVFAYVRVYGVWVSYRSGSVRLNRVAYVCVCLYRVYPSVFTPRVRL
jgi:hypothetical protein